MSVTFEILLPHNLVYVRFAGTMLVQDSLTAFRAYAQHPDARAGQRHLIDLTRITDMEHNFAQVMQLQARKAETLAARETETQMTYLANTPLSQKAAVLAKNGWSAEQGVVATIQNSEHAALSMLGLPFSNIASLLAADRSETA